jgi:type I restriction enzyme S subunit
MVRLTDLIEVNPPVSFQSLTDDTIVSFIPMSDVSDSGQWTNQQTRRLVEVRSGYTGFQEGDILFAKITPCTENGKGCHATGLANGIGFGSTEFHVLRAKAGVNPRFIFHLSVMPDIRKHAASLMGGSAGQQRVPSDFFRHVWISPKWIERQDQLSLLLDELDSSIELSRAAMLQGACLKVSLLQHVLRDEHILKSSLTRSRK